MSLLPFSAALAEDRRSVVGGRVRGRLDWAVEVALVPAASPGLEV